MRPRQVGRVNAIRPSRHELVDEWLFDVLEFRLCAHRQLLTGSSVQLSSSSLDTRGEGSVQALHDVHGLINCRWPSRVVHPSTRYGEADSRGALVVKALPGKPGSELSLGQLSRRMDPEWTIGQADDGDSVGEVNAGSPQWLVVDPDRTATLSRGWDKGPVNYRVSIALRTIPGVRISGKIRGSSSPGT